MPSKKKKSLKRLILQLQIVKDILKKYVLENTAIKLVCPLLSVMLLKYF